MEKNQYALLVTTGLLAVAMVLLNLKNPLAPSGFENVATPAFPKEFKRNLFAGNDAISSLGDKLPEAAQRYKLSGEDLRQKFKQDKSLKIDNFGQLLYEDELVIANTTASGLGAGPVLAIMPLEQTFALHSKPGASRTLYLDFNGHSFVAGKSIWFANSFDAPAFDTDGNPGVFSDSERQTIQAIWLRVAEDFAPFNINVTTAEPSQDKIERTSTSDSVYGNRVLFTPSSGILRPGSGGMSYVGVFDDVGEYMKIALVFPENLANAEKYMGEAASHEAGHSLGLWHKGINGGEEYYGGQGDWAPIMGVGYYRGVTQWSKGEYSNPSNTTDEIAIMIGEGAILNGDDYGNTISSAANMIVSGNSIQNGGLIEKSTDVDYFKFNTGAGNITINAEGAFASNLDISLSLYDSSGRLIKSGDMPGLSASLSETVLAGTYYIAIKGSGAGTPSSDGYSNYASLGQYSINGSIIGTNNNAPVAQISANTTSGGIPLVVTFSSAGSYDPDGDTLSYLWNFGDNTSSIETNPQKTYTNSGTYTATLTVADITGLSDSKMISISVTNQAPVASFSVSSDSTNIPVTVSVNGSGSYDPDGSIVSYSWDFGDGTAKTGVTSTHTYQNAGTFIIKLTVIDNNGLSNVKTSSVTAIDPLAVNAPKNLSVATGGKFKKQAALKWTDASANETAFFVERALSSGSPIYQVVKELGKNVTSYTDSVSVGSYYYRVRAYNAVTGKYSAYSNAVSARVR